MNRFDEELDRVNAELESERRIAQQLATENDMFNKKCHILKSTLQSHQESKNETEHELIAQLESLKAKEKRLLDQIEEISTKLAESTGLLEATRKENGKLQGQLESAQVKIQDLDEEMREKQDGFDRQVAELTEVCDGRQHRILELEEELERLKGQYEEKEEEVQRLLSEREHLTSTQNEQVANLRQEREAFNAKLETKLAELTRLQEETFRLQQHLEETCAENDQLKMDSRVLLDEVENLKNELLAATQKTQELESVLQDSTQQIHQLKSELKASLDSQNGYKSEVEHLRDAMQRMEQQFRSEREAWEIASKGTQDSKHQEIMALSDKLNEMAQEIAVKDSESSVMKLELDSLRGEMNNLQSRLKAELSIHADGDMLIDADDVTSAVSKLRQQVNTLKTQLNAAAVEHSKSIKVMSENSSKDHDRLQSKLNMLNEEYTAALAEVTQLREQLDANVSHNETIARLQKEVEKRMNETMVAKDESVQASLKIAQLDAMVRQKTLQIEDLRTQLATSSLSASTSAMSSEMVNQLQSQLATTRSQLSEAELTVSTLNAELSMLRDAKKELVKRSTELETNFREKDSQAAEMSMRYMEAEERIKMLEVKLKRDEDARLELQRQVLANVDTGPADRINHILEEERVRSKKVLIEEKQKWKKDFEQETSRLNTYIEDLEATVNRSRTQIAELQTDLHNKSLEVLDLQRQLDVKEVSMEGDANKYTHQNEKLKAEMDRAKHEADETRKELSRLRSELAAKDKVLADAQDEYDRLRKKNNKLMDQIGNGDASYSKIEERNLQLQTTLREKDIMLTEMKREVEDLRHAVSKEQEFLTVSDKQYKEQVNERNKLLSVIHEFLETILSKSDSSKGLEKEASNVAVNFNGFYERILAKLRLVGKICNSFEDRAKSIETKGLKEFKILRTKLETRIKQLEKFESIVRTACTYQRKLKDSNNKKQRELDAEKANATKLTTQITVLKSELQTVRDSMDTAKFSELRLSNAISNVGITTKATKDLESKVKDLEHKLVVERQGAKDRVNELVDNLSKMERQVELLNKKNKQLTDWITSHKSELNTSLLSEGDDKLININQQLRKDLEENVRLLDEEKAKYGKMKKQYSAFLGEYEKLKTRLSKREQLIAKALSRLELINDRKEALEVAFFKEATEDIHGFLKQGDLAMSAEDLVSGQRYGYERTGRSRGNTEERLRMKAMTREELGY